MLAIPGWLLPPARTSARAALLLLSIVTGTACASGRGAPAGSPAALGAATQLLVVTTPGWDSTSGALRRFVREGAGGAWRQEGAAVPIVVGRTGVAWGVGHEAEAVAGEPRKVEGDGRSPAGVFPLGSAFGFAPRDSRPGVRLPYLQLTPAIECVDDTASRYYNRIVDRALQPVDWRSSERMREVPQYELGIVIDYNPRPVQGRGSCIFFHVWAGPRSSTVGCTALAAERLEELLGWLRPGASPVVVQLPAAAYARLAPRWKLPALER